MSRVALATILAGMVLLVGAPAHAEPDDDPTDTSGRTAFTELQILPITGALGLTNIAGYDAPRGFNPESGYPTTPPAGSTTHTIEYAGAIPARDPSGTTVLTYCIDLFTDTESGVTYERGEWVETNVPNLDRVHYILQNYYPNNPNQPAGVADNVKAAAVQAAIWFFTDNYVVATDARNDLYELTSAIVADALASEPVPEPEPINLTIEPEALAAPLTGELVGPFTVSTNGPATLRLTPGVEVYADAAGTQRRVEGDTVADGDQLFVRATSTTAAQQGFSLERVETVQESTVYLFDGSDPNRETAQKLVLAQSRDLQARGSVLITPFAAGGIVVTKTLTGTGAGLQGEVVIAVECTPPGGGDPIQRQVTIPARTMPREVEPVAVTGLPAGATCTITEPESGDNPQVGVTATTIDPPTVVITENQNLPVEVTNEYALGGIAVTKTITGNGAGLQGEVVIAVECTPPGGGDPIQRQVTIPAGTTGEVAPTPITGLRVGSTCAVTEPENGDNPGVNVTTTITPDTVTILEEQNVSVVVTNEYVRALGGLRLTKSIAGPAAGQQGAVVLDLDCNPGEQFDREFTIPAGSPAGDYPQEVVTDIPAGTVCTVTETSTGATGSVEVSSVVTPTSVDITNGATAVVTATNTYREKGRGGEVQGPGLDEEVTIVSAPGGGVLPNTGASPFEMAMAVLGAACLACGATLLLLVRRREAGDAGA